MVLWTMALNRSTWTHDSAVPWACRSCAVWLLRSMGARCDEGKRERGATRFSPRASMTSEKVELSWQRQFSLDGEAKGKWRGGTRVGGGRDGKDGALGHLL
jgi:hypothetical protein